MKFVEALSQKQPAIAVPISGPNAQALFHQVAAIGQSAAIVAEWRVDTSGAISDADAKALAKQLHQAGKLLLLTNRTQAEGGAFKGDAQAYLALYQRLVPLTLPDALDIEASLPQAVRQAGVALAHRQGAAVVASAHDFHATPSLVEMQVQLQTQSTWAEVVKLATMPQIPQDTLNLLATAAWARTTLTQPAIVIGMGALGQLTRVASGDFASGLTFATIGQASAPGQLSVQTIQQLQEDFQ